MNCPAAPIVLFCSSSCLLKKWQELCLLAIHHLAMPNAKKKSLAAMPKVIFVAAFTTRILLIHDGFNPSQKPRNPS
jgi:hypothetical protein